jgi:hypothetical protein
LREAHIVGYKPWEFERLTPAEWEAIKEGEKIKQKQLDLRTALLCAVVTKVHLPPDATPRTVEDFMPKERHQQTPADHLAAIEAITAVLGGTDERPRR